MRARPAQRGSALLLAIMAIAVLGAGLMAVLALSGDERRAVLDQQAATGALTVAESGLQTFVANRAAFGFSAAPAAAYESTRVNVPGGYADVVLQRLRSAPGGVGNTYVIRSQGYAVQAQLSGTPIAGRRVAQLAVWQASGMAPLAAWTSMTGLIKKNASGTLNGYDGCGAQGGVAGIAVPTVPGYVQTNGRSVPSGSPPVLLLGTQPQTIEAVRLDWPGIVNGTAVTPDLVIPGAAWPAFPSNHWPVIRVNGDYTLPGSGQGMLIVTGTLTINKKLSWDGVILVGDDIDVNANVTVDGAVVSGLNVALGQDPPVSDLGNGNRTFQYNSCNVASALSRFGGLALIPNAWSDNWAAY